MINIDLTHYLNKFKDVFKQFNRLEYYIDNVIIPYTKIKDKNYYEEYNLVLGEDFFTFICRCGFVNCLLEYRQNYFSCAFENERTKQMFSFNNKQTFNNEDIKRINKTLFEIFD